MGLFFASIFWYEIPWSGAVKQSIDTECNIIQPKCTVNGSVAQNRICDTVYCIANVIFKLIIIRSHTCVYYYFTDFVATCILVLH